MDATTATAHRLQQVRLRIAQAETAFGRPAGSVHLLAVSKTVAAQRLRAAFDAGQRHFGENYLQEALAKIQDPVLAERGLVWHFIGPLQTNKTKKIAAYFDWVHSVDDLAIARRLNEQRPAPLPPLNICLQVNVSAEASKSGVSLQALPALAAAVAQLPRLHLRGLMAIPKPSAYFDEQRLPLRTLRTAFEQLRAAGLALDTLSMGMSQDLEAAIAEGATWVRVGSAIFGARQAAES